MADGLVLYLFWGSDGDSAADETGDTPTPPRALLRLAQVLDEFNSSEKHDASQLAGTTVASNDDKLLGISADEVATHTKYLAVLATVRLILLTFPLSYAAYTGARVPCVIAQYIFHGVCGMVVLSHMLAVLVLNPSGFEDHGETVNPIDGLVPVKDGDGMTGDAWTLLSLSLIAILLHFLIVLHVRSTGGQLQGGYEERRKRRKRLAYSSSNLVALGFDNEIALDGVRMNDRLLLPTSGTLTMKERFMCLPEQYGAFVTETQSRFDAARRMWLERLEMLRQRDPNSSSHGYGRLNSDADFVPSPTRNSESTNLIANAINTAAANASRLIQRPDPFKVLLQLFAYEDVWSNNRLDLAFSIAATGEIDKPAQGCTALSFYAPQLLSFLLHGAYFDVSQKLEQWILQKCSEDFHFAHRCFWFLRAWCMEIDSIQSSTINENLIGFEKNLYAARRKRSSSRHKLDPPSAWNENNEVAGSMNARGAAKFAPDEEVMIRELLIRVIQKGGRPASLAHYGSIDPVEGGCDELQFASSPSEIATAVEKGFVPVDPRTGFSSTKHIDVISSTRKHGFLPLTSSGAPCETIDSDTASLFFACPLFLDALLSIAGLSSHQFLRSCPYSLLTARPRMQTI